MLHEHGQPMSMELNTGGSVSLVSESIYKLLWPTKSLHTYTGEAVRKVGRGGAIWIPMCESASIGFTG